MLGTNPDPFRGSAIRARPSSPFDPSDRFAPLAYSASTSSSWISTLAAAY